MRAIGDINAETTAPSDDEMPVVYWDGRDEQFITVYNGDEYKSVGTAKDWRTGMMTVFFQIHGKTQTRSTAMPILHWENTVSKRVLKKPSSNTEGSGGGGSKAQRGHREESTTNLLRVHANLLSTNCCIQKRTTKRCIV